MVDSCSNIQTGEQFGRLLRHNFNRHFSTNRAPLGLHFHASWLKSKREFKDELIKFIEEMLKRNDVYFVNMLQVSVAGRRRSTLAYALRLAVVIGLFFPFVNALDWSVSIPKSRD
jgi:hypothetical protein